MSDNISIHEDHIFMNIYIINYINNRVIIKYDAGALIVVTED